MDVLHTALKKRTQEEIFRTKRDALVKRIKGSNYSLSPQDLITQGPVRHNNLDKLIQERK